MIIKETLYKFVSLRPRSIKEIKVWFKRKRVSLKLQEELLEKLIKLDLINDEKFASWWVEQRQEFRPMGESRLKSELLQKGISKDIIQKVFSEKLNSSDQLNYAKKILDNKIDRFIKLPKREAFKKISSLLFYRGFSYETIKKVIDEYLGKE